MNDNSANYSMLKRYRKPLLIAGPLLLLLIVGVLYFTNLDRISTDDAYVVAARTDISATVAGRVVQVRVKDNQSVEAGAVLFQLDDRDFALAVADARARLANTILQVKGLKASYRQHQAEVSASKETLAFLSNELTRQKKLVAQGVSSQAQLDQAQHAWLQAQQTLVGAQQEQENALVALDYHPSRDVDTHPAVQQARAILDRALLNQSYTVVKAPQAGIVAKVELLQPGEYVTPGAPLFALVSAQDVWVEANVKETDLVRLHPGQPSSVEIDAYPGKKFHGRVQSLSPGTGSSYSLLPPENATGNWVKVVQRLPVRIRIEDADASHLLRSGLSASVTVDVSHDH
ncbi:MAG: HlyD family secretion protein [Ferrovum sp.]|jgi:membrane fusion protein (multidrug efflux system)|nr:HlyD family secretion protein [Ferrovum sp.]NDU87794.1 HlyD family secretion protein [Ferrovum sp.]